MPESPPTTDVIRHLDDVSGSEYARSLLNLKDFTEVDVSKIQTFDDLSANTFTVVHDLRTVVLAQGVVEEREFLDPEKGISKEQTAILRKQIGEYTLEIMATPQSVSLKEYRGDPDYTKDKLVFKIPCARELNELRRTDNPTVGGPLMFAVDSRHAPVEGPYIPLQSLNNEENHFRGFVRVLQAGVKDVLSAVPKPQPLPSAFQPNAK